MTADRLCSHILDVGLQCVRRYPRLLESFSTEPHDHDPQRLGRIILQAVSNRRRQIKVVFLLQSYAFVPVLGISTSIQDDVDLIFVGIANRQAGSSRIHDGLSETRYAGYY